MTFERDVSRSACGDVIPADERTREGAYDCPYYGIGCGTGVRAGDDPDDHYNTGTMSRRSPTLNRQHPENFVDVHPNDTERYGVADGDSAAATATAAGRRRRADSGRGP